MRKQLMVAMCLLVLGSAVAGQTRESKWHCGKPTAEHSLEVGDVAGHSYIIVQGNCESTASTIGEKSGVFTEFSESWKASATTKGRMNTTLNNGNKIYYTYESTVDLAKKTIAEKWRVVNGTGKFKGAKGTGTCSGKLNDDGTSDWDCSGTTTTGK